MASAIKHILVIRLSSMGDVAMTVPVLRAFTQQYPNIKITVVTRYTFAPFFKDLPRVSVFAPDLNGKHKGVIGLYKLSKQLKALQFDAVADLHNVLRTKILRFFMPGIAYAKIDKGRKEKKALVRGKIFQQLKTTHQRYADVFNELHFPINLKNPIFPGSKLLNDKLIEIIDNTFNQKLIGIAPFAFYASKMYPLNQMEEVISVLSKTHKVILFGGGLKEIKALTLLAKKFNNVTSLAGKLTLTEELCVISNLDIMLSMDSANAHIAAMFGIKVVTIWGVTHPYAGFSAFNQLENSYLLPDRTQYPLIPTSIYGNTYPDNYKNVAGCISSIKIIEKIESQI